MVVTKEILDKGINEGCVLCYEQCRVLGMLYPPSHTWRKKFIGKELPDETVRKYLDLKDKTTVNPKILKSKRSKHFVEQADNFSKPVMTKDGEEIVITEQWLRNGLLFGKTINKSQAKVLGVNITRKGWLQGIVGSEIPKDVADEFMRLKSTQNKKKVAI